ncbi:MAG: YCF48-related protein [Candidatus Krumholzibacteria bacterium]|nr:YCF48-related protein [Candidatus Krumholzibacteria bacterium]
MQLRRSFLLALCIVLSVYFLIHSCSQDRIMAPETKSSSDDIICSATDVFFRDGDFGCVAGALGTFIITADGGKTWNGTVIENGGLNDVQFIDRSNGWVAGKDGSICHTADGGQSWTKMEPSGFPIDEDFYQLAFFSDSAGYALGYHGVYKTENGGGSWINNWLPSVSCRGAWSMSFPDEETGFLLGSSYMESDPSILYSTADGGASWAVVEGAKASALRTVLTITFVDGTTGWAGGGVIMKTMDGGESWETQIAAATVRKFQFLSAEYGFAVGGKTILRTKNGGITWENVTPDDDRIKDLRSVYFIDENNGWVAGRAADEQDGDMYYKHSILLQTRDGGATWTLRDFSYDYTSLQSLDSDGDI